ELHLERLARESKAVARIAPHLHVGEEGHLLGDHAVAVAGGAAAFGHVEREATRAVAARARLGGGGEEAPQLVPDADVGGGDRARRAPDGALVDLHGAADAGRELERAMREGRRGDVPERELRGGEERAADERAL